MPRRAAFRRGRSHPLRWVVGIGALLWLATRLPEWRLPPPTGTVTATAGPVTAAAAAVLVDGIVRGRPGEAIRVRAGEHRISLRAEGWDAEARTVAVPAGGRAVVALRPHALPVPVSVSTVPAGAQLSVDGIDAGGAPAVLSLSPGSHRLRASADGYAPRSRLLWLQPGEANRAVELRLDAAGAAPGRFGYGG